MSVVETFLARYDLEWNIKPYRITLKGHPEIIVQSMPYFDLKGPVLANDRERVMKKVRQDKWRKSKTNKDLSETPNV